MAADEPERRRKGVAPGACRYFVFSSRRRHTRFDCDWSSDVCSSDLSFDGEVTPTRFRFTSDKLVYPLKITQISVREKTEALFYVQAPFKVDLPGDLTYQYTWVPMLRSASGCTPGGLPGRGGDWLESFKAQIPPLLARAEKLEFRFVSGQRQAPNKN